LGVEEVRWEKGDTERAEDYTFLYEEGNGDHQLGTGTFEHNRIISAVRQVEFISGRWCSIIIILNVHTPSEDNTDDLKTASTRNYGVISSVS
jgi:hypothetical protein